MPYLDLNHEHIYYALHRNRLIGGVPVVLIHGAGENHLAWPAGLRRLPEATVYVLDLPGHGKSGGDGRCTVKDYVDWLAQFLDAINAPRAIVIGHSLGGAIAQLFALTHPDRTTGLVLIATGAKLRVAPQLMDWALNDLPAAADLVSRLQWGPNVPEQIVRLGKQQTLTNRPEVLHGDYLACDGFDVRDRLRAIKTPTLIIAGRVDQLTPIKYATFMAEQIRDARLVSVPDAGHMVMIEAETIVAYEVERFVREVDL
ncbi:MAG TPA: alpha/beta hydrolase [Anaerolineae bacterium]|nr:alpha/beta hydrolase [Anaerolineae bacterium]